MDYVISSGGPFNAQVVSHEEAQRDFRKTYGYMKQNAILIATGLSPLLLIAKDFKKNGFDVETCVIGAKSSDYNLIQFYVLRKNTISAQLFRGLFGNSRSPEEKEVEDLEEVAHSNSL